MARKNRDIRHNFAVPALGVGVVLLFLVCLLVFLWLLIIITRLVWG